MGEKGASFPLLAPRKSISTIPKMCPVAAKSAYKLGLVFIFLKILNLNKGRKNFSGEVMTSVYASHVFLLGRPHITSLCTEYR